MQEHIIVRLLTRIFDFILLNVLWVLCSIPVITLGASTTALYSVMLKIAENEEGYIMRDFLKAFKRDFRQSTIVWCILLGIGAALFVDYRFVQNLPGVMGTIGMVLLGMIVLVYIFEVVFVFPLIARFDNTTINMLKNAVLIPISRLPYAVFVLGLSGMCVFVTLLSRMTIMIGAAVWSVIGVSIVTYANSLLLRRMFYPYE